MDKRMTGKEMAAFLIESDTKKMMDPSVIDDIQAYRERYTPKGIDHFTSVNPLTVSDKYGFPVYQLQNTEPSHSIAVLYIHGGAYLYDIDSVHIALCDKLVTRLNADAFLPLYPLIPEGTYKEAYAFLTEIYIDLHARYEKIILIGDSCGATLALGLVQLLVKKNMPVPNKMILSSPFVDATLSSKKNARLAKKDIVLQIPTCQKAASIWAGDLPVSDHRISPINGEMRGLPETLIFTGSRELFFDDIRKLIKKIKRAGQRVRLIIGWGMFHDYAIFPIVEGDRAFEKMIRFITHN